MHLRLPALALLASSALALGCGGQKHVTYYVPPDAAPASPTPVPAAPAPVIAPPPVAAQPPLAVMAQPPVAPKPLPQPVASCPLLFRATATPAPQDRVKIALRAENLSGQAVSFTLPDNCPSGPLALRGLGAGFDYYGSCNAGACPGPRRSSVVSLGPGEARDLATTTIPLLGSACTPALKPGRAVVDVIAPQASVDTCTVGTTFEIPAPKTPTAAPKAAPATTTPAPPPSTLPVPPRPAPAPGHPPIPAPGPR